MSPEQLKVKNDEHDFYGKQYWLNHQNLDLGYPDIHMRSRNDLTERNLHWLVTLLKYKLPSAKVLELGCSHGSFVALMNQAGYKASGIEMSPWVVNFGKKTFNIPVDIGPIENLNIPNDSLDIIVIMDVLEHLPEPVQTLNQCFKLLKPDGFILVQTPQFKSEMNYSELLESKAPFLEQLKSDEHLFLFTRDSVSQLFGLCNAKYIKFESAIFSHYDMYFVVSRQPLKENTTRVSEQVLLSSASGRMAQALLDLREREIALIEQLKHCEADRYARWEQIGTLTNMVKEMEREK